MDSAWWQTPPNETKPMAIIYRGLVRFLHHAAEAGMLKQLEFPTIRSGSTRMVGN